MISFLGTCVQNLIQAVKYAAGGNLKCRNVISRAAMISCDSIPIAVSIVFIAAVVISLQISKQFVMSGAERYAGGFLAASLVREIAPGFAALAISARAGTALSAEIANMKITSQIDALKTLKVDPIGWYFAPIILAGALTVPMVTVLAELFGVLGGMITSYYAIGLHPNRYISSVWQILNMRDIYISLFRGFIFGIIIPLVCASEGYKAEGGARSAGNAVTQAAVKSALFLLASDLIITFIFYV